MPQELPVGHANAHDGPLRQRHQLFRAIDRQEGQASHTRGPRRRSKGGWRTNVAQGGTGETVQLTAEEEGLAVRAAAAVAASVAGVDLLPGPSGELYILEVNAVPGWRALAPLTGVDIAAMLLRYLASG